jgi:hypothetical protein
VQCFEARVMVSFAVSVFFFLCSPLDVSYVSWRCGLGFVRPLVDSAAVTITDCSLQRRKKKKKIIGLRWTERNNSLQCHIRKQTSNSAIHSPHTLPTSALTQSATHRQTSQDGELHRRPSPRTDEQAGQVSVSTLSWPNPTFHWQSGFFFFFSS